MKKQIQDDVRVPYLNDPTGHITLLGIEVFSVESYIRFSLLLESNLIDEIALNGVFRRTYTSNIRVFLPHPWIG